MSPTTKLDDNENNEDELFVEAELESWCNNEVDDNIYGVVSETQLDNKNNYCN